MILQFFQSIFFTASIYSLSIFTIYNVCISKNIDFINPSFIIDRNQLWSYLYTISTNALLIIFSSISINCYTLSLLDKTRHSFIQAVINIALFSLIVEFCYYLYHRLIHNKLLYKKYHSFHHEFINVYPLDSLYFTTNDIISFVCCVHLPILFIRMDLFEYFISLYFYLTMFGLSHTNICFNHHILHHKFFKCNYCLVFPYFDYLFDTYRE